MLQVIQNIVRISAAITLYFFFAGCRDNGRFDEPLFEKTEPNYKLVGLIATKDTLTFPLSETTYNEIKSFNLFSSPGGECISFYDQRSQSVNVYDFRTRQLVKRILLKGSFRKKSLYKTSVFIKSFDSVYVTNRDSLYLLDSSGLIVKSFGFVKEPSYAWAVFKNSAPPVFLDSVVYTAVRPYVKEASLKALRQWKLLYRFDVKHNDRSLHYHFPKLLRDNYYGHRFLDYSMCYNSQGRFVFSFPADTNLYETDLNKYQVAHYAKSKLQNLPISPLKKDDLINDEGSVNYLLRDSYGAVYFDRYTKRYLRVARSKISQSEYEDKRRFKKQRIIILDETFRVIGESPIEGEVSLDDLFITTTNGIYARVKWGDEYAIHFVRFNYIDHPLENTKLTMK